MRLPTSGAGGEANDTCPDLRPTGGDAVDQPVASRLPPRFASADTAADSVSAYGLRGSKLLQLMSDQHSGQFRRRLTMGMPSYSRASTMVAPVRGKAKMMSARRDKVRPTHCPHRTPCPVPNSFHFTAATLTGLLPNLH